MRHFTSELHRDATIQNPADYSPAAGVGSGRLPATNLQIDLMGLPWVPSPKIDEPSTGGGDIEIYSSKSGATSVISWTWVNQLQDPTDASAGNLAAMQTAIQAAHSDLSGVTITRSAATGQISAALNDPGETFNLLWSNTTATQATGTALGFGTADLTGADSYTAATERRYEWVSVVWDLGSAQEVEVIGLVGHNLKITDVIEVYAHSSDLGDRRDDWSGTATAFGSFTVNDEHPHNPIITVTASSPPTLQYIGVFIKAVAARSDDDLRIASMLLGSWQDYRQSATDYGILPEWSPDTVDPTVYGRNPSILQQVSVDLAVSFVDWTEGQINTLWDRIMNTRREYPTIWYLGDTDTGCLEPEMATFGEVDASQFSISFRTSDLGSAPLVIRGKPRGW